MTPPDPDKPIRIQRKRTKGWTMPDNTIYVGRPTRWGNPYKVGTEMVDFDGNPSPPMSAKDAVEGYKSIIDEVIKNRDDLDLNTLKGKNLACWCPLDKPCHVDVLLELANPPRATHFGGLNY